MARALTMMRQPVGSAVRFVRGIEFPLLRRPRGRRETMVRAAIVLAVVAAGVSPFFLDSGGQDAEEVASAGFLGALQELETARGELDALRDDPSATAVSVRALEARIADLEAATRLGYLPREGDAPREGALAPDFRLLDVNGNPLRLSDVDGPAIVNFWASWCGPCIEEMPDFERLHAALGDRVTLLGVNRGESRETALSFVERTGVTYPVLLDLDDALGASDGPYRLIGMPTTFYLRADGRVAAVQVGFQTLERMEELTSALLEEEVDLELEEVDESFAGQAEEIVASQLANDEVSAELFARWQTDASLLGDEAWRRNVIAQTTIWQTNRERFAALEAPAGVAGLSDPVAEAFELLTAAGTLVRQAVEGNDAALLASGVGLFEDAASVFAEAAGDLRDFLAAQ